MLLFFMVVYLHLCLVVPYMPFPLGSVLLNNHPHLFLNCHIDQQVPSQRILLGKKIMILL